MGEREQAYSGGNLEIDRGLVMKWKEEIRRWGKEGIQFGNWKGIRYVLHMAKGFLLYRGSGGVGIILILSPISL